MEAINYIYDIAEYLHEGIVQGDGYSTVTVKAIKVGAEWIAIDKHLNLYVKGKTKRELKANIIEILK